MIEIDVEERRRKGEGCRHGVGQKKEKDSNENGGCVRTESPAAPEYPKQLYGQPKDPQSLTR